MSRIRFTCRDCGCPKPCQNRALQASVSVVAASDGVPEKVIRFVMGTLPEGTSITLVPKPSFGSREACPASVSWQLLKSGMVTGNFARLVVVRRT